MGKNVSALFHVSSCGLPILLLISPSPSLALCHSLLGSLDDKEVTPPIQETASETRESNSPIPSSEERPVRTPQSGHGSHTISCREDNLE